MSGVAISHQILVARPKSEIVSDACAPTMMKPNKVFLLRGSDSLFVSVLHGGKNACGCRVHGLRPILPRTSGGLRRATANAKEQYDRNEYGREESHARMTANY
jgi:hypothetical protein